MKKWVKALHPLEVKVIHEFEPRDILTSSILIQKLGYSVGQANQTLNWLAAKEILFESGRKYVRYYELTEAGVQWLKNDPALSMREVARKEALTIPEMTQKLGINQVNAGKIFGQYSKEKILCLNARKQITLLKDDMFSYWDILHRLLKKAQDKNGVLNASEETFNSAEQFVLDSESKKRCSAGSVFRLVERQIVFFGFNISLLEEAKAYITKTGLTGEELGPLTSTILKNGSWKGKYFRRYSMQVPVARLVIGRRNPYIEYLESIKDKLANLGFEEFDGPLVETEFWNNDALFMPQFHSARDVHDVYHIREPSLATFIDEPYLSRVAETHENGGDCNSLGWRYSFDRNFTRRLILRSQGTVLSAKKLTTARIPGKYFGIVRCFRYDQVDATHGADFYQTEGILLGHEVNVKMLLGLLEMFAHEFAGAKEVKYVPAYFPFTEPSFEVHVKHPILGWFELGGAGVLRPEVTNPLGVEVPVLAWGIGIDRMALLRLGLSDIRDLFSVNIDSVRLRRANCAKN